ncbi:MOLPALP family lipoprotein [Mycoplasma mycoides]|uniref:MOLPALP family lipoprotein n=1 Tax=Mycoplasma mycoides TaxID=2102 RepID=UPI00223F4FF8|nr:MOLPALP family lipoprotein [Mycoplasma mycoides]QVK09634.1 MOLPALP family lipoprotein [Mycoplasma mycoides subsp. capri]
MKKLIAILSSVMMITTASLPIIACHVKEKKFDTNNSITNTQTSISLFAKELILADQLKVNLKEIKTENNKKSLTDLLKENNLKLDDADKDISNITTLDTLVDNYFIKDSYLSKNVLDSKIKLDNQTKKPSIPLFSEVFKLFGVDTADLDKLSDDILKILDLTTSLNPMFLVSSFDSANTTLKSFFEKVKPHLKTGLEKLTNPSSEITKDIQKFQDKIDVNKNYKELKAEDLDNAFYTSLVNAVGLSLVGSRYTSVKLDAKNSSKSLKDASLALAKALNGPAKPTNGNELDIIGYILEALQFLQIKLSLFESARDFTPKSANNLFGEKITNQDFIKNTYDKKTIATITDNKSSSINLKYILSFFAKPVKELKDNDSKDGFELQKLLAILFLSTTKVEYPEDDRNNQNEKLVKEYFENQSAHPIVTVLITLANDFLNEKLTPLLPVISKDAKEDQLKKTINDLLPHLYKWISYTLTSLLTGTHNVYDCLSTLFIKVLPVVLTSLKTNLGILKEVDASLLPVIPAFIFEGLVKEVLPIAFPITAENKNDKNSFKQLYSGEVFLPNKINEMFKQFRTTTIKKIEEIKKIVPNLPFKANDVPFGIIRNLLSGLENGYDKIFKNVKEFNLKGLLTTPLNKMNESWWKDKSFIKPLQNKSVADILDTLLVGLDVKGNEKLSELESSNINLTGLTDVAKVIDKYEYKIKDVDYKEKTHLLEILKSNPDKTLEILGWTSDSKDPIGKNSLLDTLLKKVFNIDLSKKDNKSENAINQLSKLITSLNSSLNESTIDQSSVEISFEFKDQKKNKFEQLLSETLIAKVKNKKDNNQSTYSFSYLRDKQDKFKFTKITKE